MKGFQMDNNTTFVGHRALIIIRLEIPIPRILFQRIPGTFKPTSSFLHVTIFENETFVLPEITNHPFPQSEYVLEGEIVHTG
jgi:hypothetical protein